VENKLKNQERNRRRAFGQNFLVDEAVIESLAADIGCTKKDRVIEIGPGNGALTRSLLRRCPHITAVEIDPKWVERLKRKKDFSQVKVIQGDASRIDWDELAGTRTGNSQEWVLVGNLPYNKAGPILRRFVPVIRIFRFMYVMVQYEVAKRITASPHTRDFGALSVFIQNYARPELRLKIPPTAFRPKPRVYSATVKLHPLANPRSEDPAFFQFVKKAFTQKRKTLVNSLRPTCGKSSVLNGLESLKISTAARPEDLSVEQFLALYDVLKGELNN
jgi:16S rRNA (adenine1518-N6/adenine1519-N6)-dimethyltransferase